MKEDWEKVLVIYDQGTNTIYFGAPESKFYPKYLEYVLEYLNVPKDATKVFLPEE